MKKARLFWPLGLVFAIACLGGDQQNVLEDRPTVRGDENLVGPRPIIVKGCLTAAGDRFVLTELDPGARGPRVAEREGSRPAAEAEPTTENYRLVGMEEQLRPLVGHLVEITGASELEQVVEVHESSPPMKPKNQGAAATSGREPRVSTVQTTRLEISDLQVNSVQSTGERCVGSRRGR
jgi:hypothetical protein